MYTLPNAITVSSNREVTYHTDITPEKINADYFNLVKITFLWKTKNAC